MPRRKKKPNQFAIAAAIAKSSERPRPHKVLEDALRERHALGLKPPRRRPAYQWDKDLLRLELLIEQETPAYNRVLQHAGYCTHCGRQVGVGLFQHMLHCGARSGRAI